MIEIVGENFKLRDIQTILNGNPVTSVFESLNTIWKKFASTDYYLGEKISSKFEEEIYNFYGEIYDLIRLNATSNTFVNNILEEDKYCLIVMDGMSLREANFILDSIKRFGDVKYTYSYSALPSDTTSFTKKYFSTSAPSQIRGDGFEYYHLQRVDDVMNLNPTSEKVVVWSTYPDQLFSEFKTAFRPEDLSRVALSSEKMIENILVHLEDYRDILITSDHGYFVDEFSWEGLKDFPSPERSCTSSMPEHLRKYCKEIDNGWLLLGRYNTVKRGKYSHVRHGGMSFLEVITPVIHISRRDAF